MQICHVAWKTAFVAGILKRLSEGGEFHHIQEKGHEPHIPKPVQSFINAHLSFRVNSNPEPRSCKTPEACENYVNRACPGSVPDLWVQDRGNANSTVRLSPDDPFYQDGSCLAGAFTRGEGDDVCTS